jgi:hypothetical protein
MPACLLCATACLRCIRRVPSGQKVFNRKRARLHEYQVTPPARNDRGEPNTKREPLNAIPFLPASYTTNTVKEETILGRFTCRSHSHLWSHLCLL